MAPRETQPISNHLARIDRDTVLSQVSPTLRDHIKTNTALANRVFNALQSDVRTDRFEPGDALEFAEWIGKNTNEAARVGKTLLALTNADDITQAAKLIHHTTLVLQGNEEGDMGIVDRVNPNSRKKVISETAGPLAKDPLLKHYLPYLIRLDEVSMALMEKIQSSQKDFAGTQKTAVAIGESFADRQRKAIEAKSKAEQGDQTYQHLAQQLQQRIEGDPSRSYLYQPDLANDIKNLINLTSQNVTNEVAAGQHEAQADVALSAVGPVLETVKITGEGLKSLGVLWSVTVRTYNQGLALHFGDILEVMKHMTGLHVQKSSELMAILKNQNPLLQSLKSTVLPSFSKNK